MAAQRREGSCAPEGDRVGTGERYVARAASSALRGKRVQPADKHYKYLPTLRCKAVHGPALDEPPTMVPGAAPGRWVQERCGAGARQRRRASVSQRVSDWRWRPSISTGKIHAASRMDRKGLESCCLAPGMERVSQTAVAGRRGAGQGSVAPDTGGVPSTRVRNAASTLAASGSVVAIRAANPRSSTSAPGTKRASSASSAACARTGGVRTTAASSRAAGSR